MTSRWLTYGNTPVATVNTVDIETAQPRTLHGYIDSGGNIVRASIGVTSENESSGRLRIRFPDRNSEFYVVAVTVIATGQIFTATISEQHIDNLQFEIRNKVNSLANRGLCFTITEI